MTSFNQSMSNLKITSTDKIKLCIEALKTPTNLNRFKSSNQFVEVSDRIETPDYQNLAA